jgi:hypothetical protein
MGIETSRWDTAEFLDSRKAILASEVDFLQAPLSPGPSRAGSDGPGASCHPRG